MLRQVEPVQAGQLHGRLGDPLRVLHCFVDLLEGRPPACAEKWEPGLVP